MFSDKVLQFPFFILSTDYDGYAIAYTCKWLKAKIRKHYGICILFVILVIHTYYESFKNFAWIIPT